MEEEEPAWRPPRCCAVRTARTLMLLALLNERIERTMWVLIAVDVMSGAYQKLCLDRMNQACLLACRCLSLVSRSLPQLEPPPIAAALVIGHVTEGVQRAGVPARQFAVLHS